MFLLWLLCLVMELFQLLTNIYQCISFFYLSFLFFSFLFFSFLFFSFLFFSFLFFSFLSFSFLFFPFLSFSFLFFPSSPTHSLPSTASSLALPPNQSSNFVNKLNISSQPSKKEKKCFRQQDIHLFPKKKEVFPLILALEELLLHKGLKF